MPITPPHGDSRVRLILGVLLAASAASLAAAGLFRQMARAGTLFGPAIDLQVMKINVAVAVIAAVAGWLCLQSGRRRVFVWGYVFAALAVAISGATLAEHIFDLDLGIDTLVAPDAAVAVTGHAGRPSAAVCVSLLLASIAIALTRAKSERLEDVRQFARLGGLTIPLFAVTLFIYDPGALNVIDGFEPTPLETAAALVLLLVAIGLDRAGASLRWNVAFVGVVVMAPLVALTVHFASAERETALSAAGQRLAAVARLGAERQDAVIAQTQQMLTFLARSDAVRRSTPACEWDLAEYAPVNQWVRALYTVDSSGLIRCADKPPSLNLNLSDRDYVKEALATGRFTISGFILARVSGQPRIAAAQPIDDSSGKRMLIVASLDVEALASPIESLGGDIVRGETVTLVDKNGVVIARRPRSAAAAGANLADATFVSEALAGPDRLFEAADIDGSAGLFVARRVLDGAGTLIVGLPKREVLRPVDVRLNRQLKLIAAILLGSLALGVLGSETLVVRPLRRLIAYAQRLEAGDLAARPDVRATGELGALARALAVGAAAIEDRERRLVAAEALFRGLFDHSPDAKAVIRVEPSGAFVIETWNSAAALATGRSMSDVIGRPPRAVFPGAQGRAIEADLRRVLDLGRVTTVEREPSINGQSSVFEMVLVPLRGPDDAIERIFLSARDISERKRVERLKNEFVSTVSHELRTPLTSIAGSLGLLSGGAAGPLAERAKHLITIAHSNSLRLVRLINDILDIEKIEAGRMTFELRSLSLRELVANALGGLKSYADDFAVTVELAPGGEGAMVYGDSDRLTQVVTNLVSNAVKFSPRDGAVTVAILVEGDAVSIVVKDRGPGVPEAFRSRIFTKFAQADGSDARRKGGTGLGLAIVREIVERHAGAVTYRTEIGEGTEFEVRLPRHVARDRAQAPAFMNLPKPPKVLVCEDDALIGAILAEQMRDAGFEAITASSVRAALDVIEGQEIDALLVDLNLPDGDGVTLIRALRATEAGRNTPVVVVSANAGRRKADIKAIDLDVAAWVDKPVDTSRLAQLIKQKLDEARPRSRVLHVEDDADLCKVVSAALGPLADVTSAASLSAARRELATATFDLVILDVTLEDGSGLDLMQALGSPDPTPVILFSARDADRAVASGAAAALTKSRTSLATLVDEVDRILSEVQTGAVVRPRRSFG